jgi:anthranilate synthase/aminodeoxychorismate synthase-like glutamine amidotransferase
VYLCSVVILIDNYDSFTWNLYALIAARGIPVEVIRNDSKSLDEVIQYRPTALLLSPGPGRPEESGISLSALDYFTGKIPILGVCLGHQLIYTYLGGRVAHAPEPRHGKTSYIQHSGTGLFQHVPNPTQVMRYHSLVADKSTLPESLEITAETDDGLIMGIQHKFHNLAGIQFHPESILTEWGSLMIQNWISHIKG